MRDYILGLPLSLFASIKNAIVYVFQTFWSTPWFFVGLTEGMHSFCTKLADAIKPYLNVAQLFNMSTADIGAVGVEEIRKCNPESTSFRDLLLGFAQMNLFAFQEVLYGFVPFKNYTLVFEGELRMDDVVADVESGRFKFSYALRQLFEEYGKNEPNETLETFVQGVLKQNKGLEHNPYFKNVKGVLANLHSSSIQIQGNSIQYVQQVTRPFQYGTSPTQTTWDRNKEYVWLHFQNQLFGRVRRVFGLEAAIPEGLKPSLLYNNELRNEIQKQMQKENEKEKEKENGNGFGFGRTSNTDDRVRYFKEYMRNVMRVPPDEIDAKFADGEFMKVVLAHRNQFDTAQKRIDQDNEKLRQFAQKQISEGYRKVTSQLQSNLAQIKTKLVTDFKTEFQSVTRLNQGLQDAIQKRKIDPSLFHWEDLLKSLLFLHAVLAGYRENKQKRNNTQRRGGFAKTKKAKRQKRQKRQKRLKRQKSKKTKQKKQNKTTRKQNKTTKKKNNR
jgi:hypothetical protein